MSFDLLFATLNRRRRDLGFTYAQVAKLSGLSNATVVRILDGSQPKAGMGNVLSLVKALAGGGGFSITSSDSKTTVTFDKTPHDVREQQAARKAAKLIGMLQATSGLEGQGLDRAEIEEMTEETVHELMAGAKKRLWS